MLSNTTLALTDPAMMRGAMHLIFSPQKPTAAFKAAIDVGLLSRPAAMVADGADFVRASLDLQRLSKRYDAFPAPLHVVVGSKDHVLNAGRQGERLARTAPGARLTRLAGLGHMVHHFAPKRWLRLSRRFATAAVRCSPRPPEAALAPAGVRAACIRR
jgi:pimeloyl-ACP methyl ester carboxylesterase